MLYRISLLLLPVFLCACSADQARRAVTYHSNIEPLIRKNCSGCHRPGEAAPFALLQYADVAQRGQLIKYVTAKRIMPPWPADPSYSHFAGETWLSDEEIAMIGKWVDDGLVEGDRERESEGGVGREKEDAVPDLVLRVPRIRVKGDNTDLFTVVKIPYEIPHDTFVRAIEFVCGNKKLIHHMNAHLISFDPAKKKNVFEGKAWVDQDQTRSREIHRELGILQDDGSYPAMTPSVSNYLPGALFTEYPEEIGGYRLSRRGALYLNDLHFGPSPVEAEDSSYFKVYYSSTPPKRPVSEFQIGTLGIAPVVPELIVPAGTVKTFKTQTTLPADLSLISIVPHMHLIGKSYLAYAVKPNGDTIPLIRIPQWDFRWQYFYQFKKLLRLPRGTTIYAEGVYDNTESNPNNPYHPPREIRERNGSMKTTDEMFQLIVTYVPYRPGDENISQE
jgi:hypothetical protein